MAGFFLASQGSPNWAILISVVIGTSLVIASGCVVNNVIDQDIDALMERTKQRALVKGQINTKQALVYGNALLVIGLYVLLAFVNSLTALVGIFGWLAYVVLYSFSKRKSSWGTLVGSLSGSMPPVAGYTAVSGKLDGAALLLFLTLVCWQMPHFYSIAIFRAREYKSAKIPVLPLVRGLKRTYRSITGYQVLMVLVVGLYTFLGYTGWLFLGLMSVIALWWLVETRLSYNRLKPVDWARRTFGNSLVFLTLFCVLLTVSPWLP